MEKSTKINLKADWEWIHTLAKDGEPPRAQKEARLLSGLKAGGCS